MRPQSLVDRPRRVEGGKQEASAEVGPSRWHSSAPLAWPPSGAMFGTDPTQEQQDLCFLRERRQVAAPDAEGHGQEGGRRSRSWAGYVEELEHRCKERAQERSRRGFLPTQPASCGPCRTDSRELDRRKKITRFGWHASRNSGNLTEIGRLPFLSAVPGVPQRRGAYMTRRPMGRIRLPTSKWRGPVQVEGWGRGWRWPDRKIADNLCPGTQTPTVGGSGRQTS